MYSIKCMPLTVNHYSEPAENTHFIDISLEHKTALEIKAASIALGCYHAFYFFRLK